MIVLGIESSCDECSVALVQDGKKILGQVIASQIDVHAVYDGVVPELASRKHLEWIVPSLRTLWQDSGLSIDSVDAIAVTKQPGLSGSLHVGLGFAKGVALARGLPWIGVDHMLAHLYAPQLVADIVYPFLGVLVSGGHTILCRVEAFDTITILGASIDDAIGEAFDKIAKHYGLGYPGGRVIDELARTGDDRAFSFSLPQLDPIKHPYDVSYSGLKNAAINQLDLFWDGKAKRSIENLAASFERVAIEILLRQVFKIVKAEGLNRLVVGGGVAANSRLRSTLAQRQDLDVFFPPLQLCGDNAAMIAGLGYHYLKAGRRSEFNENVSPRVQGFRRTIGTEPRPA